MSHRELRVVVTASELAPWAKAGGLADVAASLPPALAEVGCQVRVVVPAYPSLLEGVSGLKTELTAVPVPVGMAMDTADLISGRLAPGVDLHLIRHDRYFNRQGIYSDAYGDFGDNPERFAFFSRALPIMAQAAGWRPDVVLANDWQTGLVMALMNAGALPDTAGVFAIHNLGYLGLLPMDRADLLGLDYSYLYMNGLEYWGNYSLLKAGIVYADQLITVSPTYAKEIQTPDFSYGLDGLMRSASHKLTGILNGVDYSVWDPAVDQVIAANYGPGDLAGKRTCKAALLERIGLPARLIDRPLLGMTTRMVAQKGLGLVAEVFQGLMDQDAGLVLLGDGEDHYQQLFSDLARSRPGNFALRLGFDGELSHHIIAGSDIFLVPSLYEPCGLTQLFSLKYGTIPVVRDTGGLSDSVIDPGEGRGAGTGFKFSGFNSHEMWLALERALDAYNHPRTWGAMMDQAMAQDFSWQSSAQRYREVFDTALAARRGGEA